MQPTVMLTVIFFGRIVKVTVTSDVTVTFFIFHEILDLNSFGSRYIST